MVSDNVFIDYFYFPKFFNGFLFFVDFFIRYFSLNISTRFCGTDIIDFLTISF